MIKIDMQMPKNCLDCPACNEYLACAIPVNGRKWGENNVRWFGHGRPEWCPMKEQEAVVRCKDCKHMNSPKGCVMFCEYVHKFVDENWYCADGKRKEGNDEPGQNAGGRDA